jgi:phage-related protein
MKAVEIPVVFNLNKKGAIQTEATLKKLGSSITSFAAKIGAAVGFEELARSSVNAAVTMEKATAKLGQSLTNMGYSAAIGSKQLQKTNDAMVSLGFTAADSATSLATLVTATGNLAQAQTLMTTAADLARNENITLGEASDKIAKLVNGASKGFKIYGITLDKTLPKAQAVALATEKLNSAIGGQAAAYAQTYAGKLEILKAKFDEIQVKVGEALLPILIRLSDILVVVSETITKYITPVIDRLGAALAPVGEKISKGIVPAFEKIVAGAKLVWSYVYPLIHAVFEAIPPIFNAARAAFDKIGEAFSKNSEKLKPLSNLLNTFYNFAKDKLVPFIKDYLIASFTALGDIISFLAPYITDLISGAVAQMQLFLNAIITGINAVIKAKNFLFGTNTKPLGTVDFFGKNTNANTSEDKNFVPSPTAQKQAIDAIKKKDEAKKAADTADAARQKKLAAEAKKRADAAAAAEAKKKQLLATSLGSMDF